MNKALKIGLPIAAVVLVGAGAYAVLGEDDSTNSNQTETSSQAASKEESSKPAETKKPAASSSSESKQASGRYAAYSESALSAEGYDTNVVFFFAPWCPECRAFKEAINSGNIPEGVQILETDFDSSTELKSKYGVTLQSTFVKVDDSGNQQAKYVGYGKDKSLNSVLSNL